MIRLYAHRGSHREATENTLRAFSLAIAEGADGVELDVRETRCGQVVVFHDRDLKRLTGRVGLVDATAKEQLPHVDGATIPSLDEALDLLLGSGLEVNVEVKSGAAAAASVLARRSAQARRQIIVSSFHDDLLSPFRDLPDVQSAYLFKELSDSVLEVIETCDGVHPHHSVCTEAQVTRWLDAGKFVNVWTVNDPAEARRLASLGVTGVVSDDVPKVRAALEDSQGV